MRSPLAMGSTDAATSNYGPLKVTPFMSCCTAPRRLSASSGSSSTEHGDSPDPTRRRRLAGEMTNGSVAACGDEPPSWSVSRYCSDGMRDTRSSSTSGLRRFLTNAACGRAAGGSAAAASAPTGGRHPPNAAPTGATAVAPDDPVAADVAVVVVAALYGNVGHDAVEHCPDLSLPLPNAKEPPWQGHERPEFRRKPDRGTWGAHAATRAAYALAKASTAF
mmetsp:Transcript_6976/g.22095  ORF Transcript_6976/g.22095 Transcript_6976/m.22095 type:complete len:220 (-) Transcript_6976:67-726(-)